MASIILVLLPTGLTGKRKPPKGPTLDETMAYMVDTLNVDGHSLVTFEDQITSRSVKNAHAAACEISYDYVASSTILSRSVLLTEEAYAVILDIPRVVVGSVDAYLDVPATFGSGVYFRVQRPLTVMVHRKEPDFSSILPSPPLKVVDKQEQMLKLNWPTTDKGVAQRLANALKRALDLCGGTRDPFKR